MISRVFISVDSCELLESLKKPGDWSCFFHVSELRQNDAERYHFPGDPDVWFYIRSTQSHEIQFSKREWICSATQYHLYPSWRYGPRTRISWCNEKNTENFASRRCGFCERICHNADVLPFPFKYFNGKVRAQSLHLYQQLKLLIAVLEKGSRKEKLRKIFGASRLCHR